MHSRNSCKTLKCPRCNWHYKYQETLEIHMKEKHPENEMHCLYCVTNQSHPRLARGETYTCGYKPYRCEVCNYSTTTKGNLSIHMTSDKHMTNIQHYDHAAAASAAVAATELSVGQQVSAALAAAAAAANQTATSTSSGASSTSSGSSIAAIVTSSPTISTTAAAAPTTTTNTLQNNQITCNMNNNIPTSQSGADQHQMLAAAVAAAAAAAAHSPASPQGASRNNSPSSSTHSNQVPTPTSSGTHEQHLANALGLATSNGPGSPVRGASTDPVSSGAPHSSNGSSISSPPPVSSMASGRLGSNTPQQLSHGSQQQAGADQPAGNAAAAVAAAAILLAQQNPNALEDYINSQEIAKDSYDDPARKYKCHRCKVAFTRQSYLTAHNKTLFHRKGEKLAYPMEKYLDPNRPFKCDICKESFTQKSILLVHNNSVSHLNKLRQTKKAAAGAGLQGMAMQATGATLDSSNHPQLDSTTTNLFSPSSPHSCAPPPSSTPNQMVVTSQSQHHPALSQANPLAALGADPMAALMAGAGNNPMATALMMGGMSSYPMMHFMMNSMNPHLMAAAAALAAAQTSRMLDPTTAALAAVQGRMLDPTVAAQSLFGLAQHQHQQSNADPSVPVSMHQQQSQQQQQQHQHQQQHQQDQLAAALSLQQQQQQHHQDHQSALSLQQQQEQAALSVQQQKRARTRISEEQLRILRQYFDINNSPTEEQLQEMSVKSELPLKVIKHWFRNTLFKERQKNKDSPYNFNNPPMLALNLEEYERTGEAKVTPISDLVSSSLSAGQVVLPQSEVSKLVGVNCNLVKTATQQQSSISSMLKHDQMMRDTLANSLGADSVEATAAAVVRDMVNAVEANQESASSATPSGNNSKRPEPTSSPATKRIKLELSGSRQAEESRKVSNSVEDQYNFTDEIQPSSISNLLNCSHDTNNNSNHRDVDDDDGQARCDSGADSQVDSDSDAVGSQNGPVSHEDRVSRRLRRSKRVEKRKLSPVSDENAGIGPSSTWSPLQLQQQLFDQTWASVNNHLNNQGLSSKTSDSSSHSINSSSTNSKSKRANRTRFSEFQVKILQEFFEQNAYPKDDDLELLSKQLGLSPRVIVVWFQNARQKARKVYENRPTSASMSEPDDDGDSSFATNQRCRIFSNGSQNLEGGEIDDDQQQQQHHLSGFSERNTSDELVARDHDNQDCDQEEDDDDEFMSAAQMMRHQHQQRQQQQHNHQQHQQQQQQQQQQQSQQLAAAAAAAGLFGGDASNLLSLIAANQSGAGSLLGAELHQRNMVEALNSAMRGAVQSMNGASNSLGGLGAANNALAAAAAAAAAASNGTGGGAGNANHQLSSLVNNSPGLNLNESSNNSLGGQSNLSERNNTSSSSASQRDKRLRTQISPEQLDYLYQKYQVESNPSRKTLESIAQDVGLSKRVVQVWFQNTRARERRGQLRMSHVVAQQQRNQSAAAAAAAAAAQANKLSSSQVSGGSPGQPQQQQQQPQTQHLPQPQQQTQHLKNGNGSETKEEPSGAANAAAAAAAMAALMRGQLLEGTPGFAPLDLSGSKALFAGLNQLFPRDFLPN